MRTAAAESVKSRLRLDKVDRLPTLPLVALRLLEFTEDEFRTPRDIAALIETDQALAAKTLKMANSAFYGYSGKIASIRDAVLLVGFNAVRSTVLTLSIGELLRSPPSPSGFDREAFWLHCLACACCCRLASKRSPAWASRSEEAFLCGLLHDLGKHLFDQLVPDAYAKVVREASSRRTNLAEVEARLLELDHAAVGSELLRLWKFPEYLAEAVARHHQIRLDPQASDPASGLAAIVNLSDSAVRALGLGNGGSADPAQIDPTVMSALGLSRQDVERIAAEATELVWDTAASFGIRRPATKTPTLSWGLFPAATARLRCWEELETRYRDLFETSDEAIFFLTDLVLECNQRACQLLACDRLDLVDSAFARFLPQTQPDGRPSVPSLQEKMQAALAGQAQTFAFQLARGDGIAVESEICLKAVSVSGRSIIQMRIRDLGKRQRLRQAWIRVHEQLKKARAERRLGEESLKDLQDLLEKLVKERTSELEKAYEELKKLDDMKTAFLSLTSHELRTPLTSIRSFSEILLHYDDDPETRREFLQIIHTESERLSRLINDVLDISKIEAGRMVYHDEPQAIDGIIQEVARVQQQLLEEKALRLTLQLSPALPQVVADRDRIQQVITNLLGNAIKFSHPGKGITIRAEGLEEGRRETPPRWVKVSVSDQGVGIEPEFLEKIFEKFYQVCDTDTLDDKPKGTGLGLPICKEIVTHYQGRIWVESEKDHGSTFTFTLPATG